jgi:AcrR family transcriptional regulator
MSAPMRQRARRSDSVRNAEMVTSAAIEMFSRHGLDVTLAQIAERAGVGKATVYRTFESREQMVAAMLDHRLDWLRQRMERAVAADDAWNGFASMVYDVFGRMREDRILQYVLSPAGGVGERMAAVLGPLFLSLLESIKETGRMRGDVTPWDTALLMSGLASALSIRQDFTEQSWRRAATLALAAVASFPLAADAPDRPGRDA